MLPIFFCNFMLPKINSKNVLMTPCSPAPTPSTSRAIQQALQVPLWTPALQGVASHVPDLDIIPACELDRSPAVPHQESSASSHLAVSSDMPHTDPKSLGRVRENV